MFEHLSNDKNVLVTTEAVLHSIKTSDERIEELKRMQQAAGGEIVTKPLSAFSRMINRTFNIAF